MRKTLCLTVLLLAIGLVGCASHNAQVKKNAVAPSLTAYFGPKARIAVADFDVKAVKAGSEIGAALREIIITLLTNSNRFLVVERQTLGAADLIITAAVAEFEPQASGGKAGVGGGGGAGSGALGGLLGTSLNKAHMTLDIRIIDASTSGVLVTNRVQGEASDISGAQGAGFLGRWELGSRLSAYANTPMEKSIRLCIIEAVRYISEVVPSKYYKY